MRSLICMKGGWLEVVAEVDQVRPGAGRLKGRVLNEPSSGSTALTKET